MKKSIHLLRISGMLCLFFAASHAAFEKVFNWEQSLSTLTQMDRAIFFTYHYELILLLLFMSALLLIKPAGLLTSPLRYFILGMFALFFLIRIIMEFTLFGLTAKESIIIVAFCLAPIVLFIMALFNKNKKYESS